MTSWCECFTYRLFSRLKIDQQAQQAAEMWCTHTSLRVIGTMWMPFCFRAASSISDTTGAMCSWALSRAAGNQSLLMNPWVSLLSRRVFA